MHKCIVCHGEELREELTEEVFKVDSRYLKVEGIPSTVCGRCGGSFSRETTEKVRLLVRGQAPSAKSVTMQVYKFA